MIYGCGGESTMTGKAAEDKEKSLGWLWLFLLTIPLYFLLRWFIKWMLLPNYERISSIEIETPRVRTEYKTIPEDDLTKIKGIGPKMDQALRSAGIRSFQELAVVQEGKLESILEAANARIVDPSTWKEQARLAVRGAWEELEAFQNQL